MYQAIVSPQEDLFVAVRAGRQEAMQLPSAYYAELADLVDADGQVPDWFGDAARRTWGIELAGRSIDDVLVVRPPAMVRDLGLPFKEYASISPTYTGKGSTLAAQVPSLIGKSDVFQGCPAGHTSFHVDPLGFATMCKVGRDNPINLVTEGPDGLLRLPAIADAQMLRTGGCTGCKLSSTCRVCQPMARVYQEAKAPLSPYCQHGMKEET